MQEKNTLLTAMVLFLFWGTSSAETFSTRILEQLQNSFQQQFEQLDLASPEITSVAFMAPCGGGQDEIGGTVFGDYNKNGLDDQIGAISDVEVSIFECGLDGTSTLVTTVTTDANGDYTFTGLTNGGQYRLEFVPPAGEGLTPGFAGDNGTNVQFVTAPACDIDAAFSHPEDYCNDDGNPLVFTACFVNGDPLHPMSQVFFEESLVYFDYNSSENSPNAEPLAFAGETGAIYGLAYAKENNLLFTSAFAKRHSGLTNLNLGGLFAINVTDVTDPTVFEMIDVNTIGIDVGTLPSNAARGLGPAPEDPSNDPDAYDAVGKLGIGTIALSEDENTLWLTNLKDGMVYSIDVSGYVADQTTTITAADVTSYAINTTTACTNGTLRPFALKIHRGEVYVGAVCDAAMGGTTADLDAKVFRLSAGSFNEIANFDLDYTRGYATNSNDCEANNTWNPWRADLPPACSNSGTFRVWPTPIFSGLEFDVNGDMIIGLMDRMGHQIGDRNYELTGTTNLIQTVSGGELLRAGYDRNTGTYTLENNGSASGVSTNGVGNGQGPGGGEFYYRDVFEGTTNGSNVSNDPDAILAQPHQETSQGAIAFYPGSGDITTTALDPYSTNFFTGGLNWFSNTDGSIRNDSGFELYRTQNDDRNNFQKANGLGEVIFQCEANAPIEIGTRLWSDDNGNGQQDGCEAGLGGIHVTLLDDAGVALGELTTAIDGTVNFNSRDYPDILPNSTYYFVYGTSNDYDPILMSFGDGKTLTGSNTGMGANPDLNDSDAELGDLFLFNGDYFNMPIATITTGDAGFASHDNDAGFKPQTGVGGEIWTDTNMDGLLDNGEQLIEGVTITLYDANTDMVVATTTSGPFGNYLFTDIAAGDYYLVFNPNTNTASIPNYQGTLQNQGNGMNDSDPDPSNGRTADFTYNPAGGVDDEFDAGYFIPVADLSGFVFNDVNEDGLQDNGEGGIGGVTVTLFDSNDMEVGQVTTDANGIYTFEDIPAGDYYVVFNPMSNTAGIPNYMPTLQNQGDGTNDSDPDGNNRTSSFIFDPLNAGDTDIDAGYLIPSNSISGLVFNDANEDGLQDNGEGGIEGITVTLFDSNGNQVGQAVTTDANGNYTFQDVALGDYYVVFNPATNTGGIPNYQGSPQNQGDGTNDSDPDPSTGRTNTFSFDPENGSNSDIDAGYFQPLGTIGGTVFDDTNNDGIKDNGEGPIEGVTVTLYDSNGNEVAEVMTDANGNYSFPNIPLGDYYAEFDISTNTSGVSTYQGSPQNQGDGTNDSDPDPSTGRTNTFSFDPTGGNNNNVDAGYNNPMATIGGNVFNDDNRDGLQNDNLGGIEGVTVTLFDANDNQIAEVMTDVNGNYTFVGINSGTYYVIFDESTNAGNITDYTGSPQNQGDGTNDSDPDPTTKRTNNFVFDAAAGNNNDIDAGYYQPNGTLTGSVWQDIDQDGIRDQNDPGIGGVTVILYDANGNEVTRTTSDPNGDYNFPNIPVGDYYVIYDVSTNTNGIMGYNPTLQDQGNDDAVDSDINNDGRTNTFTFNPAGNNSPIGGGYILDVGSIGDFVFVDYDQDGIQDSDEPGLGKITVNLTGTDSNNNVVNQTTETDPNGFYQFTDLPAGSYTITFVIPARLDGTVQFTLQDVGGNDNLDSDVAENGMVLNITLGGGQNIDNVDAGIRDLDPPFVVNPQGNVTVDCNDPAVINPQEVFFEDNIDTEDIIDIQFTETYEGNENGCDGGFVIVRTWLATDGSGNSATFVQRLNTMDNTPPVLVGVPANTTANCTDIPDPDEVKAVDDCDDDPTITITDVFEGEGCNRQLIRTWTATDDCGNSSSDSQIIQVIDNEAPVVRFIHPDLIDLMDGDTIYSQCTDQLPFGRDDAVATDVCSDVEVDFYDFVRTAGDCAIDGFIWEMVCTWEGIDACGNSSQLSITVFIIDTTPPTISGVPGDITVDCGNVPPNTATVTANDTCDEEVFVTYLELVPADTCVDYKIIRRWTAIDDCGNITVREQMITVEVEDMKIIGVPDDVVVNCDRIPPAASPVLLGDCYEPELIFEETILGDTCHDYKIIRVWTGRNNCGSTAKEVQTVFVEVPDLEFENVPLSTTVDCNAIPPAVEPNLSHSCYEPVITLEETILGDTCTEYKIVRKWTGINNCGQMTMISQTITVEVDPMEVSPKQDVLLECGEPIPAPTDPTVNAACFDYEITYFETEIPGDCPDNYTIERKWVVTNSCGESETVSQIITIKDTKKPIINIDNPYLIGLNDGDTLMVECDGEIPLILPGDATATDNSDPNPSIEFVENIRNASSCVGEGYITTMTCGWIATDRCGNVCKREFTIVIKDSTPPVIENCPEDLVVNLFLGETIPPVSTDVIVTDNCSNPLLLNSIIFEPNDDNCGYTLIRTWAAVDDCGNAASCEQRIKVNDVCDCPDILVDGIRLNDADCGQNNGSIIINPTEDERSFDYTLIPDVGTSNEAGNERYDLAPGTYLMLIFRANADDCIEKLYLTINETNCLDTLRITIPDRPTNICIDDLLFDYTGTITSTNICDNGNPATVQATGINGKCVDLVPEDDFEGISSDLICVEHCFNASANQCDTTFIIVTVEPIVYDCELVINPTIAQPDCDGNAGSISLQVGNAIGNLTYQWTPNVSNTSVANDLSAGDYQVLITDLTSDCTVTGNYTINNATPQGINSDDLFVEGIPCPESGGGSISSTSTRQFQVQGVDGTDYGFTPATDLPAGKYEITTTGDCPESVFVDITQPDAWQFGLSTTPESCAGNDGAISLTVMGGVGNLTYQWTPNISTSNQATGLTAGIGYDVLITDERGCSLTLTDLSVTQDCNPTCTVAAGSISTNDPVQICKSVDNTNLVNFSVAGNAGEYLFVVTTPEDIILTAFEDPVFDFAQADSGTYLVYGIATDGSTIITPSTDVQELSGCHDLSNALAVTVLTTMDCSQMDCNADAGEITSIGELTPCTNDGESDRLLLSSVGGVGDYQYLLTTDNQVIVAFNDSPLFDLEGRAAGGYLVWGFASVGTLENTEAGRNVNEIVGCFDLSNSISILATDDCTPVVDCEELFSSTTMAVDVTDCGDMAQVCFPIPLNQMVNYDVILDGQNYTGTMLGCDIDTTLIYNAEQISGAYSVNWMINGADYNGNILNVNSLIDLMNTWDVGNTWMLGTDDKISGGNPDNAYGSIELTQLGSNAQTTLGINTVLVPNGTLLQVGEGTHSLEFTHRSTACTDQLEVTISCTSLPLTTYENFNIIVNETGQYCADTTELPGIVNAITLDCISNDCEFVEFSREGVCVNFTGVDVGIDTARLVICDNLGFCDTTFVVVTADFMEVAPIARPDDIITQQNKERTIAVLENDDVNGEMTSLKLMITPGKGAAEVMPDNYIKYSPSENYCGQDRMIYQICNGIDCDEATVEISVECGPLTPRPFSGFSPNNDGINDNFVIQNMEQFPENELVVYNRHGLEVFKAAPYHNDWDGRWDTHHLADGTYFYVFRYGNGEMMTGYVVIQR